jgi:hypothetical protein
MARGLSQLQRQILALAYRNRCERLERAATLDPESHQYRVLTRGVGSVDLYHAEALRDIFGWPVRSFSWRWDGGRPTWGQNFSKRRIGERRYRSGQASLSRAVRRLEERGLVERHGVRGMMENLSGLTLTQRGVEEASQGGPSEAAASS